MDIDDHDKTLAALEQLEAERGRRLQDKIDSGEAVSVQTTVVVGAHDDDTEDAVDRHLANLPTLTTDGRPIHYDLLVIVTGVPRGPYLPGKWVPPVQTASSAEGALPSEETTRSGEVSSPSSSSEPAYVRVTVRHGDEDDPGQIAEAWYTIEEGLLVLRDADDKHITSRGLLKGEDPAVLARILLHERAPNEFQQPIRYKTLGIA
jgi:hypothetical protein